MRFDVPFAANSKERDDLPESGRPGRNVWCRQIQASEVVPAKNFYEPNFPVVKISDRLAFGPLCDEIAERMAEIFESRQNELSVANSQYDGICLCSAVLRAMVIVVPFARCANSCSSPFTCLSPSRSSLDQVVYEPSPQSLSY